MRAIRGANLEAKAGVAGKSSWRLTFVVLFLNLYLGCGRQPESPSPQLMVETPDSGWNVNGIALGSELRNLDPCVGFEFIDGEPPAIFSASEKVLRMAVNDGEIVGLYGRNPKCAVFFGREPIFGVGSRTTSLERLSPDFRSDSISTIPPEDAVITYETSQAKLIVIAKSGRVVNFSYLLK